MTDLFFLAAAVAAAAFLYMAYANIRLRAKPEKGSLIDRLEGTVRLRDILRLAAYIENEGIGFYRRLSERAEDPAARRLCERLSVEEAAHRALVEKQLGQWRELPANRLLAPLLLEEARRKGIFVRPPAPDAPEHEMAAYAISQEIRTIEFYRAFEKAFPQTWKRAQLHMLVKEEESHERSLLEAYPHLRPAA